MSHDSLRKSTFLPNVTFPEREDTVQLTINTHVPNKWRFVDLETGDIWMADPLSDLPRLIRAQDIDVRLAP